MRHFRLLIYYKFQYSSFKIYLTFTKLLIYHKDFKVYKLMYSVYDVTKCYDPMPEIFNKIVIYSFVFIILLKNVFETKHLQILYEKLATLNQ